MLYKFNKSALIIVITTLSLFVLSSINIFAISNVNDLKDIGFEEKLGDKVPFDLEFKDPSGNTVKLGNYIKNDLPVIINLVYFSCPRVCTFALNGVLDVTNNLSSFSLGKDFNIITISFNPEEDHTIAKEKSDKYIKNLKKELKDKNSWVYLTGNQENILKLTDAVGFKFKKDGEEFAHPSGLVILTPDGKVSRYLYGIEHNTKDLKLALIEASNGDIGTSKTLNKVLLFCYQFDPVGKKYALKALNVVKAGGMVTLLALTGFLSFMWIKDKGTS